MNQVRARLIQRDFCSKKFDSLEERFGSTVTTLQQEFPSTQAFKRVRLLKIMERFSGDVEQVRKFLQKVQERHGGEGRHSCESRRQAHEELKTKYAIQLAELATAGINVNSPCILRQLEKHQGDVNKVRLFFSPHTKIIIIDQFNDDRLLKYQHAVKHEWKNLRISIRNMQMKLLNLKQTELK